jgi:hypothetical protein
MQTYDHIRFTMTFSNQNVIEKKALLTAALHANINHANKLCVMRTGWAHDDSVPFDTVVGLEIAFIVPKNIYTETTTIALGHVLADAIGETLASAERSDVDNYTI